jgi:hypothetical protein
MGHKMLGNCRVGGQLAASGVVLSSTELVLFVSYLIKNFIANKQVFNLKQSKHLTKYVTFLVCSQNNNHISKRMWANGRYIDK